MTMCVWYSSWAEELYIVARVIHMHTLVTTTEQVALLLNHTWQGG